MPKKSLLFAVIAAVLIGCSALPPGGDKSPPCGTATCQVDVSVSGTAPNIMISVNPQTLSLLKGNHGADGQGVLIRWLLKNDRYKFENDSIQFYDPNFPQQFHNAAPEGSGAQYHVRDRNTDGKPWGYLIKVYDRSTGHWYAVDPWIQNG